MEDNVHSFKFCFKKNHKTVFTLSLTLYKLRRTTQESEYTLGLNAKTLVQWCAIHRVLKEEKSNYSINGDHFIGCSFTNSTLSRPRS